MVKTLEEHFGYLSDDVKIEQYRAAIGRLVRSGHVVLDLGCGTGLLGVMALRAGARKVYFVEEEEVIEVARQTVATAGFTDRAEFFKTNSYELALPERVDVVICDHVGYFGIDYGILGLLNDARQRFLKPDGIIVPSQIELQLAPVSSETCSAFVGQWCDGSVPDEFSWLGTAAANTKHATRISRQDLLADAVTLTTLELGADAKPFLSLEAEFSCTHDGSMDGVAGWFNAKLFDDIYMTNSPITAISLDRPQAFLPLETPVDISAENLVCVTIMARPDDNVLGWIVELPGTGQRFTHTTFNGLLLDQEALTRAQPNRVAKLNNRGRARQVVLSYCDGRRTVAEVQALVQRDHPDLFPSTQATLSFVTQVLSWDTNE